MNIKTKRTLLQGLIEREKKYLAEQETGSEEYVASLKRLMELEKQESESTKGERMYKNILEGVKVVSGIALPLIGLVCITATEKDTTFCGALRGYTQLFIPKR